MTRTNREMIWRSGVWISTLSHVSLLKLAQACMACSPPFTYAVLVMPVQIPAYSVDKQCKTGCPREP
ncbi:hypothetical protein V6N11_070660 [Hibiscus sabdariffa]|uniref:Secreted protein n=1 Tax=Hibiscus sabdariffa TaxID=183260 RepID=A0ABR2QFP4_9ROSI